MPAYWKPWPKFVTLWLLFCVAVGANPAFPTYFAPVTDDYSTQKALTAGHTSFQIASRDPVRFRAKLFRDDKRSETPASAAGTNPALRLSLLFSTQRVSPSTTPGILAQSGRAPPASL
jgi:hypothetical protein